MNSTESHIDIFTSVYESNTWGDDKNQGYSGSSGGGSLPRKNIMYINYVRKFLLDHDVRSVADVGCGTFKLGPIIFTEDLSHVRYTGYDAYDKLIKVHRYTYKDRENFSFVHLDACHSPDLLATADVCILKDVLQHWTTSEIYAFLDHILLSNKFKHILICNTSNQQDDKLESDNRHRSHPLSARFLPLKKYNPSIVLEYEDKEVCLLQPPPSTDISMGDDVSI